MMKAVAGPICGLTIAKQAWFFHLATKSLDQVRDYYGVGIHADDEFWDSQRDASYATLIELSETIAIEPLSCAKRDRRGWVPLRTRQMVFAF